MKCGNCGNNYNKKDKFCENCGNKLNEKKKKKSIVLKVILWFFFLPIMLCIYVWKNEKIKKIYKIPIIICILVITYIYGEISTKEYEQLVKDTVNRCYPKEIYSKLDEACGVENLRGNFESDMECTELKLEDNSYNDLIINEEDGKLLSIKIKDGKEYKYIYNVDKSYDIYDCKTLEIKEKADEALKNERIKKEKEEQEKIKKEKEIKEKEKKEAAEKAKKLKIFTDIGLSENDAEEAFEILKKCGISKITKIEKDTEIDGVTFYNTIGSGYDIVLSIYNNKLHFVTSGTLVLYDRDANVYKDIKNYIITSEEQTDLKLYAEEYVKLVLKAPSTAEFPGSFFSPFEGWEMANDNGTYKVKSYVDSQNSFGAMLRSEFYMEFKKNSNGNLELTKFTFDGKKMK